MSRQNDIKKLIRVNYKRLQKLKEKQALYGISVDPSVEIEIEEIEVEIENLQTELKEIETQIEPLSPVEQHRRIVDGLDEQRRILVEQSEKRRTSQAQRVVGQRLSDVATFKNRVLFRQELGKMLADSNVRLISVVGRGGIGKTGLVSKVLADLEEDKWIYTDDVLHFEGLMYLSTRTTGINLERIFRECAEMLGGKTEKEINRLWTDIHMNVQDKVGRLLNFMTDGLYIILLDNMEDLLDENQILIDEDLSTFLSVSLSTTHKLKLLITTRVPIQLSREFLHFDKRIILKDGLPIEEGVQLLKELDTNGEFGLFDSSDEQLTKAVKLVQGVPRALEVIASILANDMFITLDELLNEFFTREEVINDLIIDAYKRLDDTSKMVMEALAVYVNPVSIIAIDYLLEPFAKGVNIPKIVQKLARTHNVSTNRREKTVFLHPIDSDYIYSQLPDTGEYNHLTLEHRAAED
ncbi:NB-ARC domain-containing protein [Chloroflexota bacterium]